MPNVRFGLRAKLIAAFLAVALIPLSIMMSLATLQGRKLYDVIDEFSRNAAEIEMAFTAQIASFREMSAGMAGRIQQDAESAEELMGLESAFSEHADLLSEMRTRIRASHAVHLEQLNDYFNRRDLTFIGLLMVFALIASVAAWGLGEFWTRPILQLTGIARKMAEGDFDHSIHIRANDEIGLLRTAFVDMSDYMKEMAAVATHIADGDLSKMRAPRNSRDLLGSAFHTMEQYLRNISDVAREIAAGNLTYTIQAKSADDVLGTAFQHMRARLTTTLRQVKEEVHVIEQASEDTAQRSAQDMKMVEDVLSSAEETSSSMMEMQASVEEVSANMKSLSGAIEETVTSIEEMTITIQQVASNSTGLSNSAEETFGVIQQIGKAVERLVETSNQAELSSREASESANAGQVSVREIIDGMAVINHAVSTAGDMIKALGRRSEEIGSITSVITDIADQTGLLALNASIIAAQAGEHGRGFAVVAQEVKELANRSSNAAREIEDLIKGVQAESQQAVTSMAEGRKAVEAGVTLANRGGEALDIISSSVERALGSIAENTRTAHEQASLSEHVRTYMEDVVTMVNEIARATDEQQQGAAQITQAVGNMRTLSEQVNRATTEQTRGTHHVLEAMESVTTRVQESSNRAQELARFSAELAHQTHALMELFKQFNIGDTDHAIVPNRSFRQPAPRIISGS